MPEKQQLKTFPLAARSATVVGMHTVMDAADLRADVKDLPLKKRVWGFRVPARSRIRKSASQVAEPRRENASTPAMTASGLCNYLSPDPIGIAGGDLNLYAYVRDMPLRFADPMGLMTNKPMYDAGSGSGRAFDPPWAKPGNREELNKQVTQFATVFAGAALGGIALEAWAALAPALLPYVYRYGPEVFPVTDDITSPVAEFVEDFVIPSPSKTIPGAAGGVVREGTDACGITDPEPKPH